MSNLGLNDTALVNNVPKKPGTEGKTERTEASKLDGSKIPQYWLYTGGKWTQISATKYQDLNPSESSYTILSAPNMGSTTSAHRYPKDASMAKDTDYVLFEFYEYQPPFKGINRGETRAGSSGSAAYNQSVNDQQFYTKTSMNSVILYMPEDVSTGYKANWSGKSFSNIGRDALSTASSLADGNFLQALQNAGSTANTAFNQIIPNLGEKSISSVISKITGEQIGNNEIFAATRGVVLNPNVELLFSGIDLRNFSLNYKLVPRNDKEAKEIKNIINCFRKAMLPTFAQSGDIPFSSEEALQNNFIRVPNVCRVSFMKGGGLNEFVPQYKMCAITEVDVNYTPDGSYATYGDGNMVAIGLSLSFQETKLIFADEVEQY